MNYKLEAIHGTEEQIQILYDLLSTREYSISHVHLPSFDDHILFVKNHPYLAWFLIRLENQYLGTLYVKIDNSIGLNVENPNIILVKECIDFIYQNFSPSPPIPSETPSYFYLNVSSKNQKLIEIFKELQLPKIKISFKLEESLNENR